MDNVYEKMTDAERNELISAFVAYSMATEHSTRVLVRIGSFILLINIISLLLILFR